MDNIEDDAPLCRRCGCALKHYDDGLCNDCLDDEDHYDMDIQYEYAEARMR